MSPSPNPEFEKSWSFGMYPGSCEKNPTIANTHYDILKKEKMKHSLDTLCKRNASRIRGKVFPSKRKNSEKINTEGLFACPTLVASLQPKEASRTSTESIH